MNSFVSSHLLTVAWTHAASFPLRLSPGRLVMHFSKALSVKLLITVCTIICCRICSANCCISEPPTPRPAAPPDMDMSFPPVSNPLDESEKDCSAGGAGSESPPRFQNPMSFLVVPCCFGKNYGPGRQATGRAGEGRVRVASAVPESHFVVLGWRK